MPMTSFHQIQNADQIAEILRYKARAATKGPEISQDELAGFSLPCPEGWLSARWLCHKTGAFVECNRKGEVVGFFSGDFGDWNDLRNLIDRINSGECARPND
jgi:hypothetical protein